MAEKSLTDALFKGKCPRCREGRMFTYPLSQWHRFNKMNKVCPHCGVRFDPEPGFYQGAMYVGYAFTISVLVVVSLLLYILGNDSDVVYISTVIGVMVLIAPLNYRYSRIVYLYMFGGIRYDPGLSN